MAAFARISGSGHCSLWPLLASEVDADGGCGREQAAGHPVEARLAKRSMEPFVATPVEPGCRFVAFFSPQHRLLRFTVQDPTFEGVSFFQCHF